MERLTGKLHGVNSIPLLSAVCGVDLPHWSIVHESNIRQYLIGDAADRLSAFEDTNLEPSEIERLKAENERLRDANEVLKSDNYNLNMNLTLLSEELGRPKAEQSNEPLTLEALRQMDGKPAYFQFGTGSRGYAVISWETESSLMLYAPDLPDDMYPDICFINMEYNDPDGHFGLHLLGWRAYRRKPEERKEDDKQ